MFMTLLTFKRVDAHHWSCLGTWYKRKHTLVRKRRRSSEVRFSFVSPCPKRPHWSFTASIYQHLLSTCYVSGTWPGAGATAVNKWATCPGSRRSDGTRPGASNRVCSDLGAWPKSPPGQLPNYKAWPHHTFISWLFAFVRNGCPNLLTHDGCKTLIFSLRYFFAFINWLPTVKRSCAFSSVYPPIDYQNGFSFTLWSVIHY